MVFSETEENVKLGTKCGGIERFWRRKTRNLSNAVVEGNRGGVSDS